MRSVAGLQQAMIRLSWDPAWRDVLRRGPVDGLGEPERALLLAVDPRAWTTDTHRRTRGVQALIEEFPVTAAVLGVPGVDAFFSTEAFAAVLSGRGSLALAFGAWAPAGDIAALELAIARARRGWRDPGPGLVTRPGVEPVRVGGGLLAFYAGIRERLGADPVAALASGWTPVPLPAPRGPADALLAERSPEGEVGLGGATDGLLEVLLFARTPRSRVEVERRLEALGCTPAEARSQLAQLLDEGLIVARPPAAATPSR